MKRQEFELTQEQYDKLLNDIHSEVPLIMLQCDGQNPSKQERANMAWERLGIQMGFQHMTIQPTTSKGTRFFTAEPT